jgi:hypothetical protein
MIENDRRQRTTSTATYRRIEISVRTMTATLQTERCNWERVALEFLQDSGLVASGAQAMASVA